jgi:hypothetical protein
MDNNKRDPEYKVNPLLSAVSGTNLGNMATLVSTTIQNQYCE